jgi:thiamine biosynthesis lipoprotein
VLAAPSAPQVHVLPVMGTVVSLHVRDSTPAPAAAVAATWAWLHEVDARFSTYRSDSEIRRLDSGDLTLEDAHPDVRSVLDACAHLRRLTRGAFDTRAAGGVLDPSAYVKGWALQRAAERLAADGVQDFSLTGGGDVVVRGGAWRVGIQHPHDRTAVAAVVALSDGAIATSGAYERGDHIREPTTGRAATGVLSATVTGPDLGFADALSTAVFVMGADGPAWTLGLRGGYEAMTILDDGTVLCTPGFPVATEDGA